MNSKIKVDKFVIVAFLLCMVCTMAMQAKAYDNFKVSVFHNSWKWTRFIWKHIVIY